MGNEKIILQEAIPFDAMSPYIMVKDIRFGTDIDKIQDDEGKTIIIVTHDPIVANSCHKIVQL